MEQIKQKYDKQDNNDENEKQQLQLNLSTSDESSVDSLQNDIEQGEELDEEILQPQPNVDDTLYDPRSDKPTNPEQLQARIARIQFILANFKLRRHPDIPRSTYIEIIKQDLATLYNYSDETLTIIFDLFGPEQAISYIKACEKPLPLVIRCNTLLLKRSELAQVLINQGVTVEPVQWCHEALIVYQSQVPIGATPAYLSGYYYIQDAASLLPVLALNVQPNMKVCDMAAAPGGKTTHIAQLLNNTGMVLANDYTASRIASLQSNLSRCHCNNVVITNLDGVNINADNTFDRVLLDAPCSGLGVISKDERVKQLRTFEDLKKLQQKQRQLLMKAFKLVKKGGIVVYSTCSITVSENEAVVDWCLREFKKQGGKVKILPQKFGNPGLTNFKQAQFDKQLVNARRYYPHIHNVQGFFVCSMLIENK